MGDAQRQLGELDEALNSYDRALSIKPKRWEAYCGRGLALDAAERFDEAIAYFDQALAIAPGENVGRASRLSGGKTWISR
ncbi:MAG: tetratricopeptide repeat protein [Hormoscilla sp. SP5CHS1]|nr:tetratricopeptide repeat protein [Hormoscilla sp. SP5CHS1]